MLVNILCGERGAYSKSPTLRAAGVSRESTRETKLWGEGATTSGNTTVYLKCDIQTGIIQIWLSGRHFIERKQNGPVFKENTDKIRVKVFMQKLGFWKTGVSASTVKLTTSLYGLQTFLIGDTIFFILHHEMCQHLWDFPNHQCMIFKIMNRVLRVHS